MSLDRRSFLNLGSAIAGGAFVAGITRSPAFSSDPAELRAAADSSTAPTREFRALWIASAHNIDYPKGKDRSVAALKAEFIAWLNLSKDLKLNAVISQVRPTADAFWPSPHEPWSQYLTGTQGKNPGFDVLAFQVEEAHKRNLEFHAWFNPFRVSMTESLSHLTAQHPAKTHKGWTFAYGGKTYYNPGLPEVRKHCADAIMHAVTHYNIDAVHFDDYFYPYLVPGKDYPDKEAFNKHGKGAKSLQVWRRDNINAFVRDMHERIRAAKPQVKFGISPFGIWRNKSADPLGSNTSGTQSYDAISADSRTWVKNGWVDYIAPQLYWNIGLKAADYAELARWWADVVKDTNVALYIGEASYKQTDGTFKDPRELEKHVELIRGLSQIGGQAYYNATETKNGRKAWMNPLRDRYYAHQAIIPAMPHLGGKAPATPTGLVVESAAGKLCARWQRPKGSPATSYAIYRVSGAEFDPSELKNGKNLVTAVRANTSAAEQSVEFPASVIEGFFTVTALDRTWNESAPAEAVTKKA